MNSKLLAAQVTKSLPPIEVPGPFNQLLKDNGPGYVFGLIVSNIFKLTLIVAGLWSLLTIVTAGFAWISSQGDKAAVEKARNQITYALIGLLIVAASWGLIMTAQGMLGICFGFGCDLSLNKLGPQ